MNTELGNNITKEINTHITYLDIHIERMINDIGRYDDKKD